MNRPTIAAAATPPAGSGKPPEIELWSNRYVIHPLSRQLTTWLIPTPVTPNQVSCFGVVAAACAAAAYTLLAWPFAAFAGFALHIGWHVLDGADGDLARRTGRSSPSGEVVDGICDYLGHIILYSALAAVLAPSMGAWAWLLALASGASRAVQASSYESRRRTYQHWIQGKPWLKQTFSPDKAKAPAGTINGLFQVIARGYLAISERVTAQDPKLDAVLGSKLSGDRNSVANTRELYRTYQARALRNSFPLSANARTIALFLSMLAGSPLFFFCYEIFGLSLFLLATLWRQRHCNSALLRTLDHTSA